MEKRSPVWHALTVLLMVSLVVPSLFPPSGVVAQDMTIQALPYPSQIKRLPFDGSYTITQAPMAAHCDWTHTPNFNGVTTNERAIDFGLPNRTPIYAAGDGTVRFSNWESGMVVVRIEHSNNVFSWYVHLNESFFWNGDKVKTGDLIGYSGDTGSPGSYHLHFTVTRGGTYSSTPLDIRGIPGLNWRSGINWDSNGKSTRCEWPLNFGTGTGSQPQPPPPVTPPPVTPPPTPKPTPSDRGTLRLTPATGPSGQYTAFYGTKFKPGETAEIRWGLTTGPVIGRVKVRSDGTFLGRITTRPDSPGSTRVYAMGTTSLYRTYAWYQITSSSPTMSLRTSSSETQSGTVIGISGYGYRPGEAVQIRWKSPSGTLIGTFLANGVGSFSGAIRIPDADNWNHQIFAVGASSTRYASVVHRVRNYTHTGSTVVSPSSGSQRYAIAVNGNGFAANERVEIRWGSVNGSVLGYVNARSDGAYSASVTVPTVDAGTYYVVAVGTSTYRYNSGSYTVSSDTSTAYMNLNRSDAEPGSIVAVSGGGMVPGQIVQLRWNGPNGPLLGRVSVGWDGTFGGRVTIPSNATSGSGRIYAISPSRFTSSPVTIRVDVGFTRVSPNFGETRQVVLVSGGGFQANERVDIRWGGANGTLLGYVTARSDGSYSGRITIPAVGAGTYNVVAVGTKSFRYNTGQYTITANTTRSQLNVSHVNVRPGYVILTNGNGWTPGQRLELRWGGQNGQLLGYVTVRSNGTWSGRVTIPTNARPGDHHLYAITPSGFTSVRMNVFGTSIASMMMLEDMKLEEEETTPTPIASPTAAMIGTPIASPSVMPTEEPVGTPTAAATEESGEIPVGTPMADLAEEPTEEIAEIPVGTPSVYPADEPGEIPVSTPTFESTEEIVAEIPDGTPAVYPTEEVGEIPDGTPSSEPTEESTGEISDGTPSAELTDEPVDEIPVGTPSAEGGDGTVENDVAVPDESEVTAPDDGTEEGDVIAPDDGAEDGVDGVNDGGDGSTDDGTNEDELDVVEEPPLVMHSVIFVMVDQHGAPVPDACIDVIDLTTGSAQTVCDATHDGVSDGRISLPVVEEGNYRIEVKNLPADVNAVTPSAHFLDGNEIRIQVERQPPPPEATDPPVEKEPIPEEEPDPAIKNEEEVTSPPDEPDSDPSDEPDPESMEEPAA